MSSRALRACVVAALLVPRPGLVLAQPADQPAAPSKPTPVLVVRMSQQLFADLTKYDTPYDVNETHTWEGVQVVSNTDADAQVRFAWDTSGEEAVLVVRLFGDAETQLTLDAGPAVGYARATTQFDASRRIIFDGSQFIDGEASSEAQSRATFQRVCSRRGGLIGRFVRRLTWQRLETSRGKINQGMNEFGEDFALERLDVEAKPHFFEDLARVGILEAALKEVFPEATSFRYRITSDDKHLYVIWGPEDAQEVDLSALAQRSPDKPLLMRVHMRPEQAIVAQALMLSNNAHQIIQSIMPNEIADAMENGVHITADKNWLELALPRSTIDKVVDDLPR